MSTKKIIAISANTCWYLYNFEKNLILQMQNHDYHVIAIAPADEYKSKLKSLGCDYLDLALSRCGRNPLVDIKTIFAFYSIYKKYKPTLALHFSTKNNIYGTLASWLLNIPAINTISGLGTVFLEKSLSKYLLIMLYKLSQPKAYKVIFQNLETKDIFINYKILSSNKTHLLPGCGVDLDYFSPIKRSNNNKIIFLLLARMIYDKGITEFVEAAKNLIIKYPQAKFQLLGFIDNSHPNKISIDTIKNWQSQNYIEYLGFTTDVRDHIARADVIVLPSYSEGLPRSLMEAAAMKKPIITTDIPGCNIVVEDNYNGFLCQPNSYHDLMTKMEQMICMPANALEIMGNNSRKKAEKELDEKQVISYYLDLIENFC